VTFASVLSAFTHFKVDALLAIDGIPVLFGTRAGRVWDTGGTNPVTNGPSSWTSVQAIIQDSIQIGSRELDKESNMVRPSGLTLSIAKSAAWDKYFERRRAPQGVYLTTDATVTVTSLSANELGEFTDGDYAYLGRETVKLTTIASSTSASVVARNQISIGGTRAAYHRKANAGAPLTLVPQYHTGRPAVLRLLVSESDSDFSDVITLVMADAPKENRSKGTWELTFTDGMDNFDRKVAVGLEGAPVESLAFSSDYNYVEVTLSPSWQEFRDADNQGHIYITPAEGSDAPPLLVSIAAPAGATANVVSIAYEHLVDLLQNSRWTAGRGGENLSASMFAAYAGGFARRCYVFKDYPALAALQLMLSQVGDGTNHATYDVMWGRTTDSNAAPTESGEQEKRFGAALYSGLIDVDSFAALVDEKVDGWFYVVGLRGEEDLLSILEEATWAVGGYLYVNSSGKLAIKRHTAAYAGEASSHTVTDSDTVFAQDYASEDSDAGVAHTVSVECNVPIDGDDPTTKIHVINARYRETYRNVRAATVTVTRKGLVVNAPTQQYVTWLGDVTPGMPDPRLVTGGMLRTMVSRNRMTREYRVVLPWKYAAMLPGDRVSLTHSLLNAFDGSTVSALVCEVIATQLSINDQTVTATLRETLNGKWIAPVGRLTGAAAGSTITLTTSSTLWGGSTNPARYWAAGWGVAVLDASASPPFSTVLGTTTISSISSDTQIVLSAAPIGTAAGDLLVLRDYDNASNTTASAVLGAGQRDHAFLADAAFTLGASGADAHKWG